MKYHWSHQPLYPNLISKTTKKTHQSKLEIPLRKSRARLGKRILDDFLVWLFSDESHFQQISRHMDQVTLNNRERHCPYDLQKRKRTAGFQCSAWGMAEIKLVFYGYIEETDQYQKKC